MNRKRIGIRGFIIFLLLAAFSSGCDKIPPLLKEKPQIIDFSRTLQMTARQPTDSIPPLNLAIAAMISPKETLHYYEELIHYISGKIDRPVKIMQNKTYKEVNDNLEQRRIDVAFICSGAYVAAKKRFPIEILAIPVVNGKRYYTADIIVRRSSSIQRFEDLRGKSFAFTDPLSNSGRLYAVNRVRELNSTYENYFSRIIYTHGHDYSIQAVARGMVDGATVDGLIFNYLQRHYPAKVENIRIIEESEPFGMPPIVVHKDLDPVLKEKLRMTLLTMDKDREGKAILQKLMIDKFVPGNEKDYNSIENMWKIANR